MPTRLSDNSPCRFGPGASVRELQNADVSVIGLLINETVVLTTLLKLLIT